MSEEVNKPAPIWSCKIGILGDATMPEGADYPMREAVAKSFYELTGKHPEFCFSGWNAKLTEPELAVVENRLPSDAYYAEWSTQRAAPALLEALEEVVAEYDAYRAFLEGSDFNTNISLDDWIHKARAAIAAAKGGE